MNPQIGTAVLALCALSGAYLDVRYRRLPNWLAIATAIAGLGFVAAYSGVATLPWALAHALVALVVGALLFRVGVIGGGDAKFYAGCAAWFVLQQGFKLLLAVSLAGVVLVLVWFTFKGIRRVTTDSQKGKYAEVPYGVAIAAGALLTRAFL